MTDVGLRHLEQCSELEALYLHRANITPRGVVNLLQTTELLEFGLFDCPGVTADDISAWPLLPHLDHLGLSAELLTAESVARLRVMPDLDHLEVYGEIKDPSLRAIITEAWRVDEVPELTEPMLWQMFREMALE